MSFSTSNDTQPTPFTWSQSPYDQVGREAGRYGQRIPWLYACLVDTHTKYNDRILLRDISYGKYTHALFSLELRNLLRELNKELQPE